MQSGFKRLPSVVAGTWVHGAWHEAVIGSPGNVTASMTSIDQVQTVAFHEIDHRHCAFHLLSN
jgi:hypothetical protein